LKPFGETGLERFVEGRCPLYDRTARTNEHLRPQLDEDVMPVENLLRRGKAAYAAEKEGPREGDSPRKRQLVVSL